MKCECCVGLFVRLFHGFHLFLFQETDHVDRETHEGIPLKYIFLSDLLVLRSSKVPKKNNKELKWSTYQGTSFPQPNQ